MKAAAHLTRAQLDSIRLVLEYVIANGNCATNVRELAELVRHSLWGAAPPADVLLIECVGRGVR